MAYQAHNQFDKSKTTYLKTLKLQPNLPIAYNNLAWIEMDQSLNIDQAVLYAQTAVMMAPKVIAFVDTLGWAYYKAGNYQKAITVLSNTDGDSQTYPILNYHLGLVYKALGQKENAIRELRISLKNTTEASWKKEAEKILNELE